MPEQIIYIKGPACPYTEEKVEQESYWAREDVKALQKAGHEVIQIGSPANGFALQDIQQAFRQTPDSHTVIAHIHGNIRRKKHFMQINPRTEGEPRMAGAIWSYPFYKTLAEASGKQALNIFMFSCGSGNGVEGGAKVLPVGSTLINFVREGKISSYSVKPDSFSISAQEGSSFAEQFFLKILCSGLEDVDYHPSLTVKSPKDRKITGWDLWDSARSECCAAYDETVAAYGWNFVKNHMSEEQFKNAVAIMDNYVQAQMKVSSTEVKDPTDGPLSIPIRLDEDSFFRQVIKRNMLGALCAVAYACARDHISAFQASRPARLATYSSPSLE